MNPKYFTRQRGDHQWAVIELHNNEESTLCVCDNESDADRIADAMRFCAVYK